ncbi:hypothetical protein GALL_406120 [mine drainage metagenome]|uniref:Uncharacterized protein n=1 Tax=mine drainage metagenome TaxID=410659 RepID=A0A1J5Q304_9ZZZZ
MESQPAAVESADQLSEFAILSAGDPVSTSVGEKFNDYRSLVVPGIDGIDTGESMYGPGHSGLAWPPGCENQNLASKEGADLICLGACAHSNRVTFESLCFMRQARHPEAVPVAFDHWDKVWVLGFESIKMPMPLSFVDVQGEPHVNHSTCASAIVEQRSMTRIERFGSPTLRCIRRLGRPLPI